MIEIIGNSEEKRNFMISLDMSHEELEERLAPYGIKKIYLQGSTIRKDDATPGVIAAYVNIGSDYPEVLIKNFIPFKLQINLSRELRGSELDTHFPSGIIEVCTQNNEIIACIDPFGVIHMCDFYHDHKKFPDFFEIIKLLSENRDKISGLIAKQTLDTIEKINPRIIKRVIIEEGHVDPDLYMSTIQHHVQMMAETIQKTTEMKMLAEIQAKDLQIQSLKNEIEKARSDAIVEAIKIIRRGVLNDWEIFDNTLRYKHQVVVDTVQINKTLYRWPNDATVLYVNNITVDIVPKVTKGDARARDAFHPNVNDRGEICLGELENKPLLEVLEKLPSMMRMANIDSCYHNDATSCISAKSRRGELAPIEQIWNINENVPD